MAASPSQNPIGFVDLDVGPYSVYWLQEEDREHDRLVSGLSLGRAFHRLMTCTGNDGYSFERIDGVMMLLIDEGAYRVTSKLHVDQDAKDEIMAAAVKHAWGEYAVEREG